MTLGQWFGLFGLGAALYILWQIRQLVLLLFTAVVLATAANSLVQRFQRIGIKRGPALLLTVVLGDYANAERYFKSALAIDAGNKFAKTNLANVYGRQGNYAQGIALLEGIDKRLWTKSDYVLGAWLHERGGDSNLAARYRARTQ